MRSVSAKVVKGKVVTRAKLPEGAKLTVFVHEDMPAIELTPEDEAAIRRSLDEVRAGKKIPLDEVLAILRRA